MKLCVISFTKNGMRLSVKLAGLWEDTDEMEPVLYTMYAKDRTEERTPFCCAKDCMEERAPSCYAKDCPEECAPSCMVRIVDRSVGEWAGEQMREGHALLFIGACAIAVRAIAPHLRDKLHDSPVLVMDETGRYVIPVLSGHVGGANRIAGKIARIMDAFPVITTATDLNRRFAADLFAKRNHLSVMNREGIAKVSSRVLDGQEITVSVQTGHLRGDSRPPAGVRQVPYPPEQSVDILITAEDRGLDASLLLRPREYAVGVGCKKGKEAGRIEGFLSRIMEQAGIRPEQVFALASIDRKRAEPGLLAWSRKHRVPFLTYTAEELRETDGIFQGSEFVLRTTGVDNVCERAALRACGSAGQLLCGKYAEDGMTAAVAKREWSVTFDEE